MERVEMNPNRLRSKIARKIKSLEDDLDDLQAIVNNWKLVLELNHILNNVMATKIQFNNLKKYFPQRNKLKLE